MPSRGYRKGTSDDKEPAPRRLHTRLPDPVHRTLITDAHDRRIAASRLIRSLVTAHYRGQRPDIPRTKQPSQAALRELCRIGNNLNQIARQAHLMRLHLLEAETRAALDAVNAAARRLAD